MYDFDRLIDRKHTEATKWERYRDVIHADDMLPMWLADMDLPVSKEIQQALLRRAQHPIYGYSDRGRLYYELFAERFHRRFQYDIQADDVILTTGVIYSMNAAIQLLTKPSDGILIPVPCYHPFIDTVEKSNRKAVRVAMCEENGCYVMDMKKLESSMHPSIKAIILCNPHNPTGRVFTKEELKALADFCEHHQLWIFADEIHSDFTYDVSFVPIMNVSAYAREHTIACVAPSKSFNLAGLKIAAMFVKNQKVIKKLQSYCAMIGISSVNVFAMEALKAAYQHSDIWQSELLTYLKENRNIVHDFLKEHRGSIAGNLPQGTYFYWLRFHESMHERFLYEQHLILNDGSEFGKAYAFYCRLNFACPRSLLLEGLRRIHALVS